MRVVIFSADIGAGHDLPARVLRDALLVRDPGAHVVVLDTMACGGAVAQVVVRSGLETVLRRLPLLYDLEYWLIASFPPTRTLMGALSTRATRRRLLDAVAEHRADVVVCTYPGANHVLSAARASGRLAVPVISAITDLAALRYWAHPGTDLHLVTHPESAAEVRAIAGPTARVEHVRGLTAPAFEHPADCSGTRAWLGLPAAAPVVVVSGGGWGVGDLQGATSAALAAGPEVRVVALCGSSEESRTAHERAFAAEPRAQALGFTDRMADVLAVADVLIHATAGLTVLEALVRGTRVISYGWGHGHVRLNNRAYRAFGLADVIEDPAALVGAVRRALAAPATPQEGYARLPAAAHAVAAEVTRGPSVTAPSRRHRRRPLSRRVAPTRSGASRRRRPARP